MSKNPFGFEFKPVKIEGFGMSSRGSVKSALGIRDKQILYHRAKGRCEGYHKKIDFSEMQSGHKNAASKGGSATLRNSVCVCARCNKLQGTDSWAKFMKKMGKSNTRSVTSIRRRQNRKKPRRSASTGTYLVNPITGRKEKIRPLF